jgi:uncharacterized protein (TIRG00374 family)
MWKKWIALTLKILVSGFLIGFLIQQVDLVAAKERALKVAPDMLALVILLSIVQVFIANFRWRVVLVALIDEMLSYFSTLRILYIGFFFNQALPSSVGGDAVRMVLGHRAGIPLGQAISSVFLDRVANLLALVVIVSCATPFFIIHIAPNKQPWVWAGLALLIVAALSGLVFLVALQRLPEKLHKWRFVRGLIGLAGDTQRVFLNPGHAIRALSWSIVGFVNITVAAYFLAKGLQLNVTFADFLVLIPMVFLVTTLPISIAGWGVREGATVAALGLIGVPSEGALVLSLLLGFISLAICLPGGLVWMMSSEKRTDFADAMSSLETGTAAADDGRQ